MKREMERREGERRGILGWENREETREHYLSSSNRFHARLTISHNMNLKNNNWNKYVRVMKEMQGGGRCMEERWEWEMKASERWEMKMWEMRGEKREKERGRSKEMKNVPILHAIWIPSLCSKQWMMTIYLFVVVELRNWSQSEIWESCNKLSSSKLKNEKQ